MVLPKGGCSTTAPSGPPGWGEPFVVKLRQMPGSLSAFCHFAAPVAARLSCSCSLLAYSSSLFFCACVFTPADSASVSAAAVLASGCAPVLFAARP